MGESLMPSSRAGAWRAAVAHPLLVALWLGTFLAASALEHAPHASLWFPPAAVTFAGFFSIGWRAAPAIVLACTLGTWLTETGQGQAVRWDVLVPSSLVFALAHAGAYALPALVLRRLARAGGAELTLRSVTGFLLLGALGALLAAGFGVIGLQQTRLLEAPDLFEVAAAWWIGDYAALVTLAPALALLLRLASGTGRVRRFPPLEWGPLHLRGSALGKLAMLVAATALVLAGYLELSNSRALLVMLVLPVVLQLWIVHTENLASAQAGVLAFSLLAVGAAATVELGDDALILQFAAISLAANTYLSLAAPALYAANARLRDQVSHDGLTGALSRDAFKERAADDLALALARKRPAAVIMLDMDRLKDLNDTYGHAAGDLALRALAERCKTSLREGDLLGRLSGDEFAIYLPGAGQTEADAVVAAIRGKLAASLVEPFGTPLSASFGIATAQGPEATFSQMLQAADEAMYAEKRRRRAAESKA